MVVPGAVKAPPEPKLQTDDDENDQPDDDKKSVKKFHAGMVYHGLFYQRIKVFVFLSLIAVGPMLGAVVTMNAGASEMPIGLLIMISIGLAIPSLAGNGYLFLAPPRSQARGTALTGAIIDFLTIVLAFLTLMAYNDSFGLVEDSKNRLLLVFQVVLTLLILASKVFFMTTLRALANFFNDTNLGGQAVRILTWFVTWFVLGPPLAGALYAVTMALQGLGAIGLLPAGLIDLLGGGFLLTAYVYIFWQDAKLIEQVRKLAKKKS